MKKILALVLVLVLILSLAACGEKNDAKEGDRNPPTSSDAPVSPAPSDEPEGEPGVCTPEDYDKAVDTLYISTGFDTMPTYDDVVELFGGVQGAVYSDFEYEGYSYYTWTDGTRTAILTFSVSGDVETYYAISGDLS